MGAREVRLLKTHAAPPSFGARLRVSANSYFVAHANVIVAALALSVQTGGAH